MVLTKKETILELHKKFFDTLVFDAFKSIGNHKISETKRTIASQQHTGLLSA